jgi:hypothetical protein
LDDSSFEVQIPERQSPDESVKELRQLAPAKSGLKLLEATGSGDSGVAKFQERAKVFTTL